VAVGQIRRLPRRFDAADVADDEFGTRPHEPGQAGRRRRGMNRGGAAAAAWRPGCGGNERTPVTEAITGVRVGAGSGRSAGPVRAGAGSLGPGDTGAGQSRRMTATTRPMIWA